MVSVKDFFGKLSGVQKDMFVSVATDLQASSPPEKLTRLTEFHGKLKEEIDRINGRREALGGVLNNIESVLKFLSQYTRAHGENFEIAAFRTSLQKFAADIRAEVAALRPEKKLAKKFDVSRKIEAINQRQSVSAHLFSEIFGGDTRPMKSSNPSAAADLSVDTFEEDEE